MDIDTDLNSDTHIDAVIPLVIHYHSGIDNQLPNPALILGVNTIARGAFCI